MKGGFDYVICAAGEGTRLQKLSNGIPKPLIKFRGRSLLEWSVASLDLHSDDQLIIVTQTKHGVRKALERKLAEQLPFIRIHWIELDRLTSGQLETAYLAKPHLRAGHGLVVFNADTFFRSSALRSKLEDPNIDGVIPCSVEPGDAWSFCEVGEKDIVKRVAEKVRISEHATVGLYHFRDSDVFLKFAEAELGRTGTGEKYVAPLYQKMIDAGMRIVMDRVNVFLPMGTPEQIRDYWKSDLSEIPRLNRRGTLVVDLDGTLTIDDPSKSYANKEPNLPVIEKIKALHEQGYEIVIHTARRMKTHKNNVASVVNDIGQLTIEWLRRYGLPTSGVVFGKPYAENGFYLDDRALRPSEFVALELDDILALLAREHVGQPAASKSLGS